MNGMRSTLRSPLLPTIPDRALRRARATAAVTATGSHQRVVGHIGAPVYSRHLVSRRTPIAARRLGDYGRMYRAGERSKCVGHHIAHTSRFRFESERHDSPTQRLTLSNRTLSFCLRSEVCSNCIGLIVSAFMWSHRPAPGTKPEPRPRMCYSASACGGPSRIKPRLARRVADARAVVEGVRRSLVLPSRT